MTNLYASNVSLPEIQNLYTVLGSGSYNPKSTLPWFVYEDRDCILIRLHNPDYEFPEGESEFLREVFFHEVYELGIDDSYIIPEETIEKLAKLISDAKEREQNIVVHCHAGISRSGAVVEVATMMGYKDIGRHRNPNRVIKEKLRKALGIKHSFE